MWFNRVLTCHKVSCCTGLWWKVSLISYSMFTGSWTEWVCRSELIGWGTLFLTAPFLIEENLSNALIVLLYWQHSGLKVYAARWSQEAASGTKAPAGSAGVFPSMTAMTPPSRTMASSPKYSFNHQWRNMQPLPTLNRGCSYFQPFLCLLFLHKLLVQHFLWPRLKC